MKLPFLLYSACFKVSTQTVLSILFLIIKGMSLYQCIATIHYTRWEHRALSNNKHTHTRVGGGGGEGIGMTVKDRLEIVLNRRLEDSLN